MRHVPLVVVVCLGIALTAGAATANPHLGLADGSPLATLDVHLGPHPDPHGLGPHPDPGGLAPHPPHGLSPHPDPDGCRLPLGPMPDPNGYPMRLGPMPDPHG